MYLGFNSLGRPLWSQLSDELQSPRQDVSLIHCNADTLDGWVARGDALLQLLLHSELLLLLLLFLLHTPYASGHNSALSRCRTELGKKNAGKSRLCQRLRPLSHWRLEVAHVEGLGGEEPTPRGIHESRFRPLLPLPRSGGSDWNMKRCPDYDVRDGGINHKATAGEKQPSLGRRESLTQGERPPARLEGRCSSSLTFLPHPAPAGYGASPHPAGDVKEMGSPLLSSWRTLKR